jgi:anti-sigma B factor antagonist
LRRAGCVRSDVGQDAEVDVDGWPPHITCAALDVGPGILQVAVAGDLDMASAPVMRRFLDERLDAVAPGTALVLDLSRVVFLSAAGLRELVGLARAAGERGVALRLEPVSGLAERILEVSGAWRDIRRAVAVGVAGVAVVPVRVSGPV